MTFHVLTQVQQCYPENNKVIVMGHINEPIPIVWKNLGNCFQMTCFNSCVSHSVFCLFPVHSEDHVSSFLPKEVYETATPTHVPSAFSGIFFFFTASQSPLLFLFNSQLTVKLGRSDSVLPSPLDFKSLPTAFYIKYV